MIDFAFKNKHLIIVLALLTGVISLVAVQRLPVDILPNYNTSAVQVLTLYPGMPAEVMEKDITSHLERWTGQANGIDRQETTTAETQLQASDGHLAVGKEALRQAAEALEQSLEREKVGTVKPFEVFQSQQFYLQAQIDYLKTVADYNKAQFALKVAHGEILVDD